MLSMNKNNNSVVKRPYRIRPQTFFMFAMLGVVTLGLVSGCSSGYDAGGESAEVAKTETSKVMTPVSNSGEPSRTSPIVERLVVRNGSLTVRVPDVEKSEKEVTRYASSNGGFVSKSESSNLSSTSPTITMTVRIPVRLFDSCIETFETMGTRLEKKTSGEDVTTKIVDYDARLKTMLAQEDSFRNMLRTSGRSTEALDLQTRLMNLRGEIESMQAQRRSLADTAALSTVELTLVGSAKPAAATDDQNWLTEAWNSSTSLFGSIGRAIGSLAVFLLVFSPIWGTFVALVWWLTKRGNSKPKPV